MVQLEGLIEKHGLLKWPRVSSRPEDVIVLDGARWTVEFVFSDGILHMRRGQTCGEPEGYGAFVEELEDLVERMVARGGKVADGTRKED